MKTLQRNMYLCHGILSAILLAYLMYASDSVQPQ